MSEQQDKSPHAEYGTSSPDSRGIQFYTDEYLLTEKEYLEKHLVKIKDESQKRYSCEARYRNAFQCKTARQSLDSYPKFLHI